MNKSDRPAGATALVRLLLERLPQLTCLATSRQPLHLGGEQEFPVPPLRMPAGAEPPERLLERGSVALYADRAQLAKPDFAVTERNAEAVAGLCRKLEGMPLAIEMAAAWAKLLPPTRMLERLERQLDLLVSRRRDLPPRHQSLRATIEWSYGLLSPEQQACFARLSVFRGGWNMEGAEAVCGGEALRLLSELQEQSLVVMVEGQEAGGAGGASWGPDPGRYRMLEPLREYAREKLQECGEEATARAVHAAYFLKLAETAEAAMSGPEQLHWLNVLEAEHDNLRAALAWCLEAPGDGETGLRLACAVTPFWVTRHYVDEGRRYLDALLSSPRAAGRMAARAAALCAAGSLAAFQGDFVAVHAHAHERLAICEQLGDQLGIARALYLLSARSSSWEEARRLATRSLALFRECHDSPGTAYALTRLSEIASAAQDYEAAHAFHGEALAIARSIGDRLLEAGCLLGLGGIEYDRRDYAAARDCFQGSLALARELGWHNQTRASLYFLGRLAFQENDYQAARAFWEECREADRRNRNKGCPVLGALAELATVQGDYATARTRWEESLAEGRELGLLGHVAHALRGLADTARLEGDFAGALPQYREGLQAARVAAAHTEILIADERYQAECAACLRGIAAILGQSGREEQATRLLGAAETLAEATGATLPAAERTGYQGQVAALRRALGEEAFAAAWAEGRALSLEQAIDDALSREEPP